MTDKDKAPKKRKKLTEKQKKQIFSSFEEDILIMKELGYSDKAISADMHLPLTLVRKVINGKK